MFNQAKLNRDLAYQFLSFLLNEEVSSIKKVNEMAPMPKLVTEEVESNNIDNKTAIDVLNIVLTDYQRKNNNQSNHSSD